MQKRILTSIAVLICIGTLLISANIAHTQLLYVDGKLEKERPFAGPMAAGGTETEIGHAGDGGFMGLIDEVVIYNRSLSEKEIEQNFKAKGLAVEPVGKLATRWAEIKVLR